MSHEAFELMMLAQREAAKNYALSSTNPMEVTEIFWLWAINKKKFEREDRGDDTGKWLIFKNPNEIVETWEHIREATGQGLLGFASKCATKKSFEGKGQGKQYLICVYTKDYKDMEDVTRVRDKLRTMGIDGRIPYKTDEMTERKINGSKYYF